MYFVRDRYRFKKDILRRVIAIKIMLIDSRCNIIILDKGVFSKHRQLLGAMKVFGLNHKVVFRDSAEDKGIQVADFIASSARYIKHLNAYAYPFIKIYKK